MAEAFVIDRAAILERLGGDEDIYAMMLDMFVQDVDNNCAAIAKAFASGNPTAVQREAHTLKGLLATVSDDVGAADAYVIEKQAKGGDIAGLDGAVDALQQRIRYVGTVLQAELAK
ncbi:Hpt domain-containing protein [Azonexus sp. IMCC34839]|uniref:Hpt domain-containing protein n=1 Tax=Azonexus sp. IMCC34839 TaxID=3133695 RepID=UPI003999685F